MNFSKNVQFTDAEGKRVYVEIEVKDGKLSMTGNIPGYGSGQCQDEIKPANEAQKKLIDIWEQWHNNDMHAGTPAQERVTENITDYNAKLKHLIQYSNKTGERMETDACIGAVEIWTKLQACVCERDYFELIGNLGVNEFVLFKDKETLSIEERTERFLFGETLLFDSSIQVKKDKKSFSYRYGSAWLTRELPSDIDVQLANVVNDIGGEFVGSSYEVQANDFLTSIGVKFSAVFLEHGKHFQDDKEKRDRYKVGFSRGRNRFSLMFGQSIANAGKAPSAYDVLACVQKYDVGSLENFCSEFGYDSDSRKAEKIYKDVCQEYAKVSAFFSAEELEQLQNIQ